MRSVRALRLFSHCCSASLIRNYVGFPREDRDRLYRRKIEGRRFPRRFLIVCRAQADLQPSERQLVAFLRRRLLDVVPGPHPEG